MGKKLKIFTRGLVIAVVVAAASVAVSYLAVVRNANGRTHDVAEEMPYNKFGLLLASSPLTEEGEYNQNFGKCIKAAAELYKEGKVDYILASGGDFRGVREFGCDEPRAARDSLSAMGVSPDRIILDLEGTGLGKSVVNAKEKYGLDRVTLIARKDHNERAMYLADNYALETTGYNAAPSAMQERDFKNMVSEILARPKMFFDILLSSN